MTNPQNSGKGGALLPQALRKLAPRRRRRSVPGAPPGVIVVDPEAPKPTIRALAYGPDAIVEETLEDLDRLPELLAKFPVVWVDVEGLGDAAKLEGLGRIFELHPLALEDVASVHQRPKVEQYEKNQYLVVRSAYRNGRIETEQVSLFLGRGFVLSFLERPGDRLNPVRERIRKEGTRIRRMGADYLAYALLDALVDHHFPLLEDFGEILDDVEGEVLTRPRPETIRRLHGVRHDLLALRRAVWPLREMINSLRWEESPLWTDETRVYLRDCHDHAVQQIDLIESYREVGTGLLDVFLSSQGNRLNEVMKVLTIIATIFIPLSFIAGLYGMNFNPQRSPYNMPELDWRWGYPFALGLMALVAALLVYYFYRKGWLGESFDGGDRTADDPPEGPGRA